MPNDAPQALRGVRVLDLGVGMPAAIAVKIFADHGADVVRFEPAGGDPFYDRYPAYRIWQRGKEIRKTLPKAIAAAAAEADICVIGGEDHPDLDWRHDAEALRRQSDKLVVLNITGAPVGWAKPGFPAVEVLAQARSGLVFEHYPDRPFHHAAPFASYGAALHGAIGALSALFARERTGRGDIVNASLLHGAVRWGASVWVHADHPTKSFKTLTPKGVLAMRLRCADGKYVQLAPNVPGGFGRLYDLLGIDDPTFDRNAPGAARADSTPRNFFGNVELIAKYVAKWKEPDLIAGIRKIAIPGETVLSAGGCWDDPQTIENGIVKRDGEGWQTTGSPLLFEPAERVAEERGSARSARGRGGPLAGVRIVDLGSFAAGPHASVVLGDLGADVIKIERPTGDQMRPQFHHYAASNRGKRSVAVDAKSEDGNEVIRRICATADIVHHNFRPGVSARLGLDRDSLKSINPSIIVLESSAYGPRGPKAEQPGFDSVFQAISGHLPGAGGVDNPPVSYRFAPIDYSTGVIGALGMVLGLLLKQRAHRGTAIYASLLNSGIFLLSELVRTADGTFLGAPINSQSQLNLHPAESLYQTADGWIAVAARGEAMAQRFARVFGFEELAAKARTTWGAAEEARFADAIRPLESSDALARLHAANVWAELCANDIGDVLDDPQMEEWGTLLRTGTDELGTFLQIGFPLLYADNGGSPEGRAHIDPIGGHTREILADCGFSQDEIQGLLARGVVA